MKKTLRNLLLAGTLASLIGCDFSPEIKETGDLTGDGIQDVVVNVGDIKYLFIGKKDGTYIKTWEIKDGRTKYFKTNDGRAYFWDGQFYRESPQREKQ